MHLRFGSLVAAITLLSMASNPALRPLRAADAAAAAKTVADKSADDKPLREQTIYIPYDKLRQVFEQSGRGVFLPYDKFQELWLAARRATLLPPRPSRPWAP